jgi:hypothetical protein
VRALKREELLRAAWGERSYCSLPRSLSSREVVSLCICRPYSPDFKPIEEAFAKVKGLIRKAEARTQEALLEAIVGRSSALGVQDAMGFFVHCGSRATVQPF